MSDVPKPSESGRMSTVTAMPKRRSAGPVTSSCSRKLIAPSVKLKVPKNRVSASASPAKLLIGHEAQLKRGPLRGDGHEKDQRRHQPQVRAARDLAHRVTDRLAAPRHQARDDLAPDASCSRSTR